MSGPEQYAELVDFFGAAAVGHALLQKGYQHPPSDDASTAEWADFLAKVSYELGADNAANA